MTTIEILEFFDIAGAHPEICTDNTGQIVLYTGLKRDPANSINLIPMTNEDLEG